ncbi:MAG: tetratricopeptide repeat protein [Pseudomonadota bacterium]
MASDAETVFRFGTCVLDLESRKLTRNDEVVALQPRVFDLLVFLIAQRDRAVDKHAIQDAVWRPAIVSETALTRAIMKARRAVGDDADQQSVIRTVHGHGYQFVATLDHAQASSSTSPVSGQAPKTDSRERRKLAAPAKALAALAALVLIAGLVWVGMVLQRQTVPTDTVRIAVLPVVNATGDSDYDYTSLGFMGLTNDLLADVTDFELVNAADVLTFIKNNDWDGDISSPKGLEAAMQLRAAFGASHVLVSQLEANPGGLRLSYALQSQSNLRDETTMVSDDSVTLVRGMVRGVATLLSDRRHVLADNQTLVDDDPFINEAYARAISVALEGRCAEAIPLFDVVLTRSPQIVRARLERAGCLYRLGASTEAESAYRALLQRDDVLESDYLSATAYRGLGKVLHVAGRRDEAGGFYQQALAIAEGAADKATIGPVLISMAILAKDRRDFDEAKSLLARATLIYRQLEWSTLPGSIFSTQANIAMNTGELDAAEQYLNDALASFRGVGDRRNEAMMLNNFGYLRRLQGRFEDAEPLHLQSLAIRRHIDDHVGQGRILGMLSTLYVREGRLDDARDAAIQAVEIARAADDMLFLGTGFAQLGAAERASGNLTAATQAYEESNAAFTQIDDVSRAAQVQLRLADIDVLRGEESRADQRIANVLSVSMANDLPEPAIEALLRQGDSFRRQSQNQDAIATYEQALMMVDESGVVTPRTVLAMKLAALYLDTGDIRSAESMLGHIVEQEQTADTLKIRARYASQVGERSEAVSLMQQAKKHPVGDWSDSDEQLLRDYMKVTALGNATQDD